MSNKKIAIIGSGMAFHSAALSLMSLLREENISEESIIVIDDIDTDPQLFAGLPPIKYEIAPQLKELFPEKKFICKGKHEYREVNGEWICECGRNVND